MNPGSDLDDQMAVAAVSDAELVANVVRGDECSLQALYRRYARPIYAMVLRMLGDEQTTEEAVQDVFVRLWRGAARFDAKRARVPTWLLGMAHNLAVDELRRRRARPFLAESPDGETHRVAHELRASDPASDPERAAESSDIGVTIRNALAALPGEQRAAIELAYFSGLSQREIAAATGVPLGTIKSRIRWGMLTLQKMLDERGYGVAEREVHGG